MKVKIADAGIVRNSVVDGPGLRYVIFVQGCYHNCEGCHNPQSHDPKKGSFYDTDEIIHEFLTDNYDGITFSGGEPFLQPEALADIAIRIKEAKPDVDIICYTGYEYEELLKLTNNGTNYAYCKLLRSIDYLIDGRFDKKKASLDCPWRGSTNQRIIDVKKSIQFNEVIETEL